MKGPDFGAWIAGRGAEPRAGIERIEFDAEQQRTVIPGVAA